MWHGWTYFRGALCTTLVMVGWLLIGCSADPPQDHLAKARAYIDKNNDAAAILELRSALQQAPDLPEARLMMGSVLLRQGDPKAAELELRKALSGGLAPHRVQPELARALVLSGKEAKVIEEFGSAKLDDAKAQADLLTSLAAAFGMTGKPGQSASTLALALAADPTYAPAKLMQARAIAVTGDFAKSLAVIDEVIVADGKNPAAWVLKGTVQQFGLRQFDEALSSYRSGISVSPKHLAAHLAAIKVLADARKIDDARKQFEQLKAVAPKHPLTRLTEGRLAFQRGDLKLAREAGQELLRLSPDNAEVLLLMGGVESEAGSLRLAEAHLNKVLSAHPGAVQAWRLLQLTHLKSGQAPKALAALETAIAKGPLPPELLALAGEIYLFNGNAAKAEEYFDKSLKHDPKNADTRVALALTRISGPRAAEALDELQQVAEADSGIRADLALISVHLRRGESAKALATIDRLERKLPKDARPHELRGRVLLAMRDRASARKSFERALEVQPEFFVAAARLSAMDLEDKNPSAAKARLESLLSRNPRHELALLGLADLSMRAGASKDEVVALFNRAIEASPGSPGPRIQLVDYLVKMRDARQALIVAQSAAANAPESIAILEALGRAQQAAGEVNQAVSTHNKITTLVPNSPTPHVRLAGAYMKAKDPKAAERSLRKALEIRPDDLQAQKALVVLLLTQKRADEAIAVARQVQQQRAKEGTGHVIEGDIRSTSRDLAGAAAAYRAALKAQPTSEAAGKLHVVLMNAGKAAEAEAHASAWMKAYPKDARFMTDLADAALERKDLPLAERAFEALLKVQPNNPAALNNMAWVRGQLKRDDAISFAERANQAAPNQPYILDTLAMLLSAQGQHARAIELQRKAAELQPSHTAIRMNLARIYVAAGNAAAAAKELDTLIKLGPNHPVHVDATALRKTLP